MTLKVNIPELRHYMQENGISEYGLSKQMNMDYSHVYRVLRGGKAPGQRFIGELVRTTGKSFESLFILDSELPVDKIV